MIYKLKYLFVGMFLFILNSALTQKKIIDHTTYDEWNDIEKYDYSEKGQFLYYTKTVLKGNDTGYVYHVPSKSILQTLPRVKYFKMNKAESLFSYEVINDYDSIRKLKLDDVAKKDWPEDTLKIYSVIKDSTYTIFSYENYKTNNGNDWFAYTTEKECSCQQTKKRKKKKKKTFETDGKWLNLQNPVLDEKIHFEGVTEYEFSENGKYLSFATHCKNNEDSVYLHVVTLEDLSIKRIYAGVLDVEDLTFDFKEKQLSFIASEDTSEVQAFSLYYYTIGQDSAQKLVDTLHPKMPKNWSVDEGKGLSFSKDGKRLFFGVHYFEDEPEKDTLLDKEKAEFDLWSYKDAAIQPYQLKKVTAEKNRTFLAYIKTENKDMVVLEDSSLMEVFIPNDDQSATGFIVDPQPYRKYMAYTFPWANDVYKVNIEDGSKKLLKDSVTHNMSFHPEGKFFAYYNAQDTNWYSINTATLKESCLTCTIKEDFADDVNGSPYAAYGMGDDGWLPNDRLILQGRRDLWVVDPHFENQPICITKHQGDKEDIRFSWANLERDSAYIQLEESIIVGVNDDTKATALYQITDLDTYVLTPIYEGDFKLATLRKVNGKNQYLFKKSTLHQFPDLEITADGFKTTEQITDVNPQQKDYNWANVEQVNWDAYDGTKVRGLLYTPENLDTTKKYPMIVYFYERNTDMLHHYYTPKPTASIVFPTEYASNGYVVFIPDVEYEIGHPARSAYNCIVSGTDAMLKQFPFIDSTRMGLQGQSWGGYQTAQLITMTTRYKAAMAGAPVSNMFSAYGGIRWGSGLSRQFQYERTQSRIGKTIWEAPELYIENSPIFHLPKVETPLLIMHNDDDGAVPWYQGIEMFMGLSRLNKPVWLLNYNGDSHNLYDMANRRDLSRRMLQFFDYYLNGKSEPEWMNKGIPAIEKQKNYGFDRK